MSTHQPEALRLADELDGAVKTGYWEAAAELRRLHAANLVFVEHFDAIKAERDQLLGALNLALEYWSHRQQRYTNRSPVWVQEARAAIAACQPQITVVHLPALAVPTVQEPTDVWFDKCFRSDPPARPATEESSAAQPEQPAPGMAVQALAGEIIEALLADEKDGGYDLTAGMFGPAFSKLVRRRLASTPPPPAQPAPVPTNCRHCGGPDNVLCGGQCKAAQPAPSHPDDLAVDRFAVAMKDKLAKAREKGRSGWETCPPDDLSRMLREHVGKGDPRDVANFAMMLWSLGAGIAATPPAAQPAVQEGRDWSLLEATQESLREHMAEIKRLKAAQPAPVPLTLAKIRTMWGSENGLEECDLCKFDDFVQVVRFIESASGITEKGN